MQDVSATDADQQEYREAHDTPGTDAKGRILPECMTDRQLLKELVTTLRRAEDELEVAMRGAKSNPMLSMLFPK